MVLRKKNVKGISDASIGGKDQSSMNCFLTVSDWDEEKVQERYVKKIMHLTNRKPVSLIIDDSIAEKTGKHIEGTQYHKDHSGKSYVFGHQIITAMILCCGLLLHGMYVMTLFSFVLIKE